MRAWCRQVWPSAPWLIIFLGLHFLATAGLIFTRWSAHGHAWYRIFTELQITPIFLSAWIYGLYRVVAFHPIFRKEYHAWLSMTPWNPTRPLPLGPVHCILPDLVLLVLALAAAFPFYGLEAMHIAKTFAFSYLFFLCLALIVTREFAAAAWMAFGLGWMSLLAPYEIGFFGSTALTYALAYRGLKSSLRRFPWTGESYPRAGLSPYWNFGRTKLGRTELGWPFDQLSPRERRLQISFRHGVIVSVLSGWLLFGILNAVREIGGPRTRDMALGLSPVLFIGLLGVFPMRLLLYEVFTRVPPISFWGRLRTGRLIIPGYDKVFAAPVAVLLVTLVLSISLYVSGLDDRIVSPLSLTCTLLIAITLGPSSEQWLLTGKHRILPGSFGIRPRELVA